LGYNPDLDFEELETRRIPFEINTITFVNKLPVYTLNLLDKSKVLEKYGKKISQEIVNMLAK
jgi:hypothetical protein